MNTAIRTIKLLQIKVKLCGDKILARIQKHAPDLGPWDVFWILELIFAFYKVFWILERVLVSRKCSVPTSHRSWRFSSDAVASYVEKFRCTCPIESEPGQNNGLSGLQ